MHFYSLKGITFYFTMQYQNALIINLNKVENERQKNHVQPSILELRLFVNMYHNLKEIELACHYYEEDDC